MDPIAIKHYLQQRKVATLHDIAVHFRSEAETVRPMLDIWVGKGKVKKIEGGSGCSKGCCSCDPATIESYLWLAEGPPSAGYMKL